MTPEQAAAWAAAIAEARARSNDWTQVVIAEPEPTTDRPRDPSLRPPPPDAAA